MTISFTRSEAPGGCQQHVWALVSADATGDVVEVPGAADKCVQFSGTWGGATAVLQGSNDNGTWFSLHNASDGSALSFTADGLAQVIENPRYIRPKLTVAGAGATVTATLLSRTT